MALSRSTKSLTQNLKDRLGAKPLHQYAKSSSTVREAPKQSSLATAFGRVEHTQKAHALAKSITGRKVVLGKWHEGYTDVADFSGARRFSVSAARWNKMKAEGREWESNRKFLDAAIANRSRIILSSKYDDKREINPDGSPTYYKREIDYLKDNGYKLADNGLEMIKL